MNFWDCSSPFSHLQQMIFLIEGIITCGLAIISYWTLTDRPATARWLNEEEKRECQILHESHRTCS